MNKHLYNAIEITQMLANNKCTYNETEEIIKILQDWIKQSRENYEYETSSDYIQGTKTAVADNVIIQSLNHVKEIC